MTSPTSKSSTLKTALTNDPVGSAWRRWEPHIHTPGTAMSDAYDGSTLEDFLNGVEAAQPQVEAIGITDYYLTRRYEEVLAEVASGRLPDVGLVFCNIEMRLTIETKAGVGVNMHLLVSPEDPDHVSQLKRFLSKLSFYFNGDNYACTEDDLRRLGYAYDPAIKDAEAALRAGVNQFKVTFNDLRKLYDETDWARANILVAVAGSSNDGTAGLQDELSSFAAARKQIERFSHMIFTATPKNIAFWRGEGVHTPAELQKHAGGAKPCLHGSDAHSMAKVCKPDGDRLCWIKGDCTFDSLRQACMEPASRVHIGPTPPSTQTPYSVQTIATPGLPWLVPQPIPLNSGMIAIIGARGSGKTALADLIGHAGDSPFPMSSDQSFLQRAATFLGAHQVAATWNGAADTVAQLNVPPDGLPEVNYLTQQFVDRLCSSVGQSDELLEEIKRVVFVSHDPSSRIGAENFDALVTIRSSETQLAVDALNQRLDRLSQDLLVERTWYIKKSGLERDLKKLDDDLKKTDEARQLLIQQPGGKDRGDYYNRLSTAVSEREQLIEKLTRAGQAYRRLGVEVARYAKDVFPQLLADLKRIHPDAAMSEAEWSEFVVNFAGDPTAVVAGKLTTVSESAKSTALRSDAEPSIKMSDTDLAKCGLEKLRAEQRKIGEQIGVDKKNVERLKQLTDLRATQVTKRERTAEDLKRAQDSPDRLAELLAERSALYGRFFDLIVEQCGILEELYSPLKLLLSASGTSAEKLSLRVARDVNVEAWAKRGEDLLDLRKNGKLRGRGSLAEVARTALLVAWRDGSANDVEKAMEAFRAEYDETFLEQSFVDKSSDGYQQWIIELARWLYSTDHIKVQYVIEYEGVPIVQLSPGTRGIVLLLLYLSLDLEDSRPLIIDQPEENLDPRSVFSELVDLFRHARNRRQVIIVTHNANLVVNTDVDQVIVASCVKPGGGSPPEFHYQSGGLENPAIRAQVCDILEGGEAAFRQRARRLRVSFAV